jgi:hypothetical protein
MVRNIIELILLDHEQIITGIDQLMGKGGTPVAAVGGTAVGTGATEAGPAATGAIASSQEREQFFEIAQLLQAHMAAEEAIFYPRLEIDMREMIDEARREHDTVKALLHQVAGMRGDIETPLWVHMLNDIRNNTLQHVQSEQNRILPRSQNMFSVAELEEMGLRFEEEKRIVLGRPAGAAGRADVSGR